MSRDKLTPDELDQLEWLLDHNAIEDITEEMRALTVIHITQGVCCWLRPCVGELA